MFGTGDTFDGEVYAAICLSRPGPDAKRLPNLGDVVAYLKGLSR